jgi:hypothetical protein
MFKEFYQKIFENAPVRAGTPNEEEFDIIYLTNAVESRFCQDANDIYDGNITALSLKKSVLLNFRGIWEGIHSNIVCFACLARKPENTLGCKHSLCDPCTLNHGSSSIQTLWTIKNNNCPLCNAKVDSIITLKPPTAGVRVLAIDGRSVKGMVPIVWLEELQSILQLPIPIQHHFDFVIGTSSGTLDMTSNCLI